jgi:hypothetical protein
MGKITNVLKELKNLGETVPTGVWAELKSTQPYFNDLVYIDDETGVEYINKSTVGLLKSVYQRIYQEPQVEFTTPQYKYVIEGEGFNSPDEIYNYLSGMLRAYAKGISLNTVDRAFLSYLLCRSPLIQKDVAKHGVVVDLTVDVKKGNRNKNFNVIYLDGWEQHISMKKYVEPDTEVLVDLWGKNGN